MINKKDIKGEDIMVEGIIIKYYRQKANLTQAKLGQGICSATHISKIERGLTEYAPEIIDLLCIRLKIQMDKEIHHLTTIKEKLDLWHEMIIVQNMTAAEETKEILDKNPLIQVSEYQTLYQLLTLKHYLKKGKIDKALKYKKKLPKKDHKLPTYEKNLYKHVLGIYYMTMLEFTKSINLLKSIDLESYSNPLVYHDLATAYHHQRLPVLSYHYAEIAQNLYKKRNNFLGIIDTESVMAIQIEAGGLRDYKETKEQYQHLLVLCDLCHDMDKKAKVLHNFAYENLRRKKYKEAEKLYRKSMALKEKESGIYLISLEGYIRCCMEGNLLSREQQLILLDEGLEIAEKIKETGHCIFLTLLKYAILQQENRYFSFIATKALPFFIENGHKIVAQRYQRQLFEYYKEKGKNEQALNIASQLINSLGDE